MQRAIKILDSKHYPYEALSNKHYRNVFVLGLGSNTAKSNTSSVDILESTFKWLYNNPKIHILCTSPILRNPPFGYTRQNDFYNAIMLCESNMPIRDIYTLMFYIERRFARRRKRDFKNAPRTLDVDLICFNALRLNLGHLQLPHRFYTQRVSVMLPLSFIDEIY